MTRRTLAVVVALAATFSLLVAPAASAGDQPPDLETLEPGGFRHINQDLNVNVVFLGYQRGTEDHQIDRERFNQGLPETYRTIVRAPNYGYGIYREIGVNFRYRFRPMFAGQEFEDAFFGYLSKIAEPQDRTAFQESYNAQKAASLAVGQNHWIDAPSVEQWLADNAGPMLNIDTGQYTIFMVNWYGRRDFKFHVYTKTDEPDPDTGYDFGTLRATRKMIAWGGTSADDEESGLGSTHRIWFYDLSAGPEAWTDNWNVDDADVDGDGVLDYRLPPIWEYGNSSGYRPFDDLSGDLGKVARYVGVDVLFTTSPLYDPALTEFFVPRTVEMDINVYEGDPDDDGSAWFDLGLLEDELEELQPTVDYTSEMTDQVFSDRARKVLKCTFYGISCYEDGIDDPFAQLYTYHRDRIRAFVEGDADYEVPIFAFNTTSRFALGPLGYADDNYINGDQTYVFGFDNPFFRSVGYGFTTTFIHEVGHHIGLSHPHDGYDSETGVDFDPSGDFYFAWSGDQSNSMMSYIDLNWDFSQFDFDNMGRYMTATYINRANELLGRIYAHPDAGQYRDQLLDADQQATDALDAYAGMSYVQASMGAAGAYALVEQVFRDLRMSTSAPSAGRIRSHGPSPKYVDQVHPHRGE